LTSYSELPQSEIASQLKYDTLLHQLSRSSLIASAPKQAYVFDLPIMGSQGFRKAQYLTAKQKQI